MNQTATKKGIPNESPSSALGIIPNLLQWEGSALVVDPKGTNAIVTAARRREMGQAVHILDPFGVVEGEETAGFNPLDCIDPDSLTIVEDIGRIAEALVIPEPGDRNRHFTDSARDLVAGYIAQIVTDPDEEERSLYTLRRYLSFAGPERDDLLARMMMNDKAGFLPRIAAQRILNGGTGNELASIVSTALTQTGWLSSAAMREVLTHSSFDFAAMKDVPTTIYVVVPPEHLEFHKRFVRLVINLALAAFSRGGRAKVPGLFLIDEVAALGRMDEIAKAYGLLAGYNMIVWCFFQDKGQLDRLYGDDASVMISSSRAIQVFAVGDEATVGFVVGKLGRSSIKSPSALRGGMEVMPLREPVDIPKEVGRKQFRQYILRHEDAPMILERVEYWQAPFWNALANPDPDYAGQDPVRGTGLARVLWAIRIAWSNYVRPALSDAWDEKSITPLADMEVNDASPLVEGTAGLMMMVIFTIGGLIAFVLGGGFLLFAVKLLLQLVFSSIGITVLLSLAVIGALLKFNRWFGTYQLRKQRRLEESHEIYESSPAKQNKKTALYQERNGIVDWEARRKQEALPLENSADNDVKVLSTTHSPSALGSALDDVDHEERERRDIQKPRTKPSLLLFWLAVLGGLVILFFVAGALFLV